MKKWIPNAISIARMVLSLTLLATEPITVPFYVIYLICGLSDIADGYLARKWKVETKTGAIIDSIADILFLVLVFYVVWPVLNPANWAILVAIDIIAVKGVTLIAGVVRFGSFGFIHTYLNKVTGIVLFLAPMLLQVTGRTFTVIFTSFLAIVAALEELVIILTTQHLERDRKSLFFK